MSSALLHGRRQCLRGQDWKSCQWQHFHHICDTDSYSTNVGAEAPGGELAEPHAQLHSLLEASDGGQPQPTPLQPASAPPEQPLLT